MKRLIGIGLWVAGMGVLGLVNVNIAIGVGLIGLGLMYYVEFKENNEK